MQNIYEILKAYGLEIPSDKKAEFDKAVLENYKTVAEVEKINNKLTKTEQELGTAKQSLSNITGELQTLKDSNANAEDWKKKYDELKLQQDKTEQDRQKAKEDAELTEAITAVFGDKKFTSDYVRNGIIADMKTEIAKPENKGKGYSELFEMLTKDKEGIFQNPNPPANMSGMGSFSTDSMSEDTMRAVMGLSSNKE